MTFPNRPRLTVLVEDYRTAQFTRSVCRQFGIPSHDVTFEPIPVGRGSGKQWVTQQYPELVRKQRSKSYQPNIATLVVTDVDELTSTVRRAQLAESLKLNAIDARTPNERIVLWLPKWHIETWIKHFSGDAVDEDTKYSHSVSADKERAAALKFFEEFKQFQLEPAQLTTLPSLRDAYMETTRLDP